MEFKSTKNVDQDGLLLIQSEQQYKNIPEWK